jgi:hypothetical protein
LAEELPDKIRREVRLDSGSRAHPILLVFALVPKIVSSLY